VLRKSQPALRSSSMDIMYQPDTATWLVSVRCHAPLRGCRPGQFDMPTVGFQ
jgi:hypothetical protein